MDEIRCQGVIIPVDHPTNWVNLMVAVEKKNTEKLRICINPRPLNKAIKREHYHLPTIKEITTRLNGAKYFSTLDARSGFWQKHGVQTLLGMINYVAKFAPNVSERQHLYASYLRKTTRGTGRHEQSLNDIKKILTETSPGILPYYDPKLPIGLQTDASKPSLCAVLIQDSAQNCLRFSIPYRDIRQICTDRKGTIGGSVRM